MGPKRRHDPPLLTVTTALAIVVEHPPFVSAINSVRSVCDAAYPRWMPHINLVYPFIAEHKFGRFAVALQEALKDIKPFVVKLEETSMFSQASERSTIHFAVYATEVEEVVKAARKLMQGSEQRGESQGNFAGHLTLAQFPAPSNQHPTPAGLEPSAVFKPPKKLLSAKHLNSAILEHFKKTPAWRQMRLQVKEVCLIARTGDRPFEVVRRVPLGVPLMPTSALSARVSALNPTDGVIASLVVPMAVKMAKQWIARMTSTGKLPKTLVALRNSICKGPCIVQVQLDSDILLAQLIGKGWIKRTTTFAPSDETVTVIPIELARTLMKRKYTTKRKFVTMPPTMARNPEALKAAKKFHTSKSVPGIEISQGFVNKVNKSPPPTCPDPKAIFGNAEAFAWRLSQWLARVAQGAAAKGPAVLSESAFRKQLADAARLSTLAPVEDVVKSLLSESVVSIASNGDLSYDPQAAVAPSSI